jgi:hypothetical protein
MASDVSEPDVTDTFSELEKAALNGCNIPDAAITQSSDVCKGDK